MKILVISQYFWPENFRINDLSKFLSKKNDLTILTSKPSYPNSLLFKQTKNIKKYGSIKLIRLPTYPRGDTNLSIILNYITFILFSVIYSFKFILKSNFDKIVVFGTSPPSGLFAAHIIRTFKKIPVYYWILDLWPETLSSIGINKKKLLYKILNKFMNYSYLNCKYIFCQSNSIKLLINRKIGNDKKTIYFPSWSENLKFYKKKNYRKLIYKDYFNVMFTGNIGESQDFKSIIKAALILKNEKIKWIIVGTGRNIKNIKLLVSKLNLTKNFIFLGQQKPNYIKYLSSLSDCLLISLKKKKIFSITIPGKLSNYMEIKKPIIGMIDGETQNIIKLSKSGLCCDAGNYHDLSRNIIKLRKMTKLQRKKLGMNGFKFSNKYFNKKLLLKKFENYLEN